MAMQLHGAVEVLTYRKEKKTKREKNMLRPSLMELLLGTENMIDSRHSKPDAQDSVDNLIITRIFQIGFGQQVLTNIQIFNSEREDGSTMRYAKAPPRDFRYLPRGCKEFVAPEHLSDEGNTTRSFTLEGCVCLC